MEPVLAFFFLPLLGAIAGAVGGVASGVGTLAAGGGGLWGTLAGLGSTIGSGAGMLGSIMGQQRGAPGQAASSASAYTPGYFQDQSVQNAQMAAPQLNTSMDALTMMQQMRQRGGGYV